MTEEQAQHLRHTLRRYDELSFKLYAAKVRLRKLVNNGEPWGESVWRLEKEIAELTAELAETELPVQAE